MLLHPMQMDRVLAYPVALAEVLAHADTLPRPARIESLELLQAQGRVLAEPIRAERDQPPFARSTRDGYAVRSADLQTTGVALQVIGSLRAGESWSGPALAAGEALEIMTGAPMPPEADAVLMVEHTLQTGAGKVQPVADRRLSPGENVVAQGAEAQQGATLVPAGRRVQTPEISLAASCGMTRLQVYARPRVAVIATGDELVELDATPNASQIRDSNSYTLASLVGSEGAVGLRLPRARDTRDDLHARLQEAAASDLILFSGGVSMGKYDLVETVLLEAGAEFVFTGARIQPGRPVVFGRFAAGSALAGRPFFGLPGNPISTEVCFRLFVAPLLRALSGQTDTRARFAEAQLEDDVAGGAKVMRFLPALLSGDAETVKVRLVPWHGSGDLAANGRANGFAVLPMGVPQFRAGERVRVLLR